MKASDIVRKGSKSTKSSGAKGGKTSILDWIADRKNNNKKHMAKAGKPAGKDAEEDEE